jgi:protein-S-isoprenylcysteine O-methyltransferase Ste14
MIETLLEWLQSARYALAVFLVIFLPPAIAWWFLVHPLARFWRRLGPKAGLTVIGVLYLVAGAALFPFRDLLLVRDLGFRPLLAAAGLPVLVAGMAIALKRKKHLTTRILVGIPEMSADPAASKLLDQGIYGRIRHPRYVEFSLAMIGWSLILAYLGIYLMTAAILPLLHLIVVLEERELRDRFGPAYAEYAARVPRYLPRRG